MKRMFFAAFALLACFAPPALADGTPSPQLVQDLIARTYRAAPDTFLLKRMNGPEGGFRVVFVHEGTRYTLDHDYWVEGIQVWERPNGTGGVDGSDAYADRDDDGVVDFGTDGHYRIFAPANYHHDGSPERGLQHRAYWQERYSRAILALQATLRD